MNKNRFKTFTLALTCAAAGASLSQAASLSSIGNDAAVTDWSPSGPSDGNFSGDTFSTTLNNWARNDNFNGSDFSNINLTIGDGGLNGNQPFLNATIVAANFSGATFNWIPFNAFGTMRVNMFRHESVGDGDYARANFANTTWNITLAGTAIGTGAEAAFFNDGSGATNAATAANAVDFTGANFSFSGAGAATLNDDVAALLITNLGGIDAGTNIGAKYDATFVSNNFADFGYASGAALESALDTAGWQAVPEPSSTALLGLGGLALILRRRK